MSNPIELSATVRTEQGSAAANRLRREEGLVPAIIYGAGKQPQLINIEHRLLQHALEQESTFSQILQLNIDGQLESVVLKEVQRHPARPRLLHADFLRVNAKEKITMAVPLHYEGEADCVAIKAGGVASHLITEIEISCLPGDLPEYIAVSVAQLGMGESLHLSDIVLPAGIHLIAHVDEQHNAPIFSIHAHKGATAADEETAASAETIIESTASESTTATDAEPSNSPAKE